MGENKCVWKIIHESGKSSDFREESLRRGVLKDKGLGRCIECDGLNANCREYSILDEGNIKYILNGGENE